MKKKITIPAPKVKPRLKIAPPAQVHTPRKGSGSYRRHPRNGKNEHSI